MTDETRGRDGEPGSSGSGGAPGAMTCDDALKALLEAEPSELRGEGGAELSVHVRGCPRCAAVAAELVAGEAALARGLDALAPTAADDVAPRIPGRERTGRRREWWRWAAPVAAAAAAAGLLFLRGSDEGAVPFRRGTGDSAPRAEAGAGEALRVSVPEGRDVVVFETGEPDITVVWLY